MTTYNLNHLSSGEYELSGPVLARPVKFKEIDKAKALARHCAGEGGCELVLRQGNGIVTREQFGGVALTTWRSS